MSNYVKESMGFTRMEDWYQIKSSDISSFGGQHLLNKFKSPHLIVTNVFPSYDWILSKFSSFILPKSATLDEQRALLKYPLFYTFGLFYVLFDYIVYI